MLRRRPERHGPLAQLLIAWSPLSLILVAYAVAGWVSAPLASADDDTNRLGFPLHVSGPADADRAVFGTVPSVWLQARLLDGADGAAHWYDAVSSLVYVTHVVAIPVATALVWFRLRERFGAWLVAVLAFTALGTAGYVAYPAAPPWWASEAGEIGQVQRISDLGWQWLHLDAVARLLDAAQGDSNPVAAMPSLHAGSTLLVTVFLWPAAGRLWRAVLVAYVVLMAMSLVYTGEHYVVDVVVGWLVAAVAGAAGLLALTPSRRPSTAPPRR